MSAAAEPRTTLRRDLHEVLRRYGFLGVRPADGAGPFLWVGRPGEESADAALPRCYLGAGGDWGVAARPEPPGGFLYPAARSWFRPRPVYRPLLAHTSFAGPGVEPLWLTADGRAAIAWWDHDGRLDLLVGLDVAEELVRYTQGDPAQVDIPQDRSMWGYGHERAVYLYQHHTHPKYPLEPWADNLGYFLAETLGRWLGVPLLAPLPGGARGGVLLTGDDDQAWLEKYDEQLRLVGDFPITYLLLPHTRHTPETLAKMPANVEFGLHVDALEAPDQYDPVCRKQYAEVCALTGRTVRVVRNHGHLNRDYWGHLAVWDECGLDLDLNVPGMSGTARTGTFLPFRVRRADGSWSPHYGLLSGYSDSLTYALKWSGRKQARHIRRLADQVERARPGVLVFNWHPQNVTDNVPAHRAIMAAGRRPGWAALGADSYLGWLKAVERVELGRAAGRPTLLGAADVPGLAVRVWSGTGWDAVPAQGPAARAA